MTLSVTRAPAQGSEQTASCRHCRKPLRRCTRIKSKGFIHASGDCKGWVHAVDGWHSCVREGPVWVFAEPEPST